MLEGGVERVLAAVFWDLCMRVVSNENVVIYVQSKLTYRGTI